MTTYTPDLVQIKFQKNDEGAASWYSVVVRDRDGMLVYAGPLSVIRRWLDRNGYKWIAPTDGWWRRDVGEGDRRQ